MVSKKTRNKRKKANIHLAMHILSMRQRNYAEIFNDALVAMSLKIDELHKEIERLKSESYDKERTA